MLTIKNWLFLSAEERKSALARPEQSRAFTSQVSVIINEVKNRGDEALFDFTREFDGVELLKLRVSEKEIQQAEIEPVAMQSLMTAIRTITNYHEAARPLTQRISTSNGVEIERVYKPVSNIGMYVPGGNFTPLVSSLLMQAIPAKVAGCPQRIVCTPPDRNGAVNPALLVAARLCGIDTVFKVGGAQAIAAMAYGTESIAKMDKLFGPGNAFVTEAKTQVAADPAGAAIDMPAGPSEVMVIAEDEANPIFVAADLLAQAEHGKDSQAILLCESAQFAAQVKEAVTAQIKTLSRKTIIQQALQHSLILVCPFDEQVRIINTYAPEHLILHRSDASDWIPFIHAAGTIFIGEWAAETLGDYVTGSNHVLPTNGYARQHGGLSTIDFMKAVSVQSITSEGIRSIGQAAITLALMEGLDAHASAVRLRLNSLGA
ncbi:histidinol dehydrogenase [Legionella israelensis]|uniref:Histidinol dehydrogenase n=1 Tax=Legionella israelensis TaxID=454 RepID=A0AAX1EEG4_9GAMM|nr:histidinol dehydrogenase [Legionella israelensis]QBR83473.1 histidinol dehydrogenase [Legionella israelensis]